MASPILAAPSEVSPDSLILPLLILLLFVVFAPNFVSLVLVSPLWVPFLVFLVYVFIRLCFDVLAFYRILPPHLQIAHFMFPRIPHDPVAFYLVPDPVPPPIDLERLTDRIDREISLDKFYRDRALQQQRLREKLNIVKEKEEARKKREAEGIFGPMDERYFSKHRARKRESKWESLKSSISRQPSENYGGGTAVRSINAARGNSGQLSSKKEPGTPMPWPQPKEVAISRKRLNLHAALHPRVVQEIKSNMAKAEAERKKIIPPPHLQDVSRAYWLIQMKKNNTKPFFVNPLHDDKSSLTGKAPDGRIYDRSDYGPCN